MLSPCNSCGHPVKNDASVCHACGAANPLQTTAAGAKPPPRPLTGGGWQANYEAGQQAVTREAFQAALGLLSQAIVEAPTAHLAACHALRGYSYLRLADYQRAFDDCGEAVRLNPADSEALAWRGAASAGLQRWREAIEDFVAASEISPDKVEYEQIALSHTEAAIADFRERVKRGESTYQLFYDRGVIYSFRGETKKAIRDFSQAIEADGRAPDAYFERARCLHATEDWESALADCTKALSLGRVERDSLLLHAMLSESAGEHEAAIDDLNAILVRHPDDLPALRQRSQILSLLRRFEQAHRDLSLLLEHSESTHDLFVARGLVRSELGDHWGAAEDFSDALVLVPEDAETLSFRGEARLAANQPKKALDDFDMALQINPACASARRGRALVYSVCGKHKQALVQLEKTMRLDPRYGLGVAAQGRVYQGMNRMDAAIEAYDRGLELIGEGRGAADSYYRRGVCRAALGNWDQAIEDLDAAISRRANHAGAYVWRCQARFRQGDWMAAIQDLEQACTLNPNDTPHYRQLAAAACDAAIGKLTQRLSEGPTVVEDYLQRARVNRFLGNYAAALNDAEAAKAQDPSNGDARVCRARLLHLTGEHELAEQEFESSVAERPADAELRIEYAESLFAAGMDRRALQHLQTVLEEVPHSWRALKLQATILTRHGKARSALECVEKALQLAPQRAELYSQRARLYADEQDKSRAIESLTAALLRDPQTFPARMLRAELHFQLGAFSLALADYEAAVAIQPESPAPHRGRALALARLDRHDEALRELTKVIRIFSKQDERAELVACRARVALNGGLMRRAAADFQLAAKTVCEPRLAREVACGLGFTLFQLGQSESAEGLLREVLQADPGHATAKEALSWLEGEQREPRPNSLQPPRRRVKLQTPPVIRQPVASIEGSHSWNEVEPLWQLWLVTAGDEVEYGPVDKSVLDQWCLQGRLDSQTLVLRSDWDQWRWASDVFPDLGQNDQMVPDSRPSGDEVEESREQITFPEIRI